MNLKRMYALFVARNMEFFRDRTALGWNFLMPLFIVIGFSLVFTGDGAGQFKVGYPANDDVSLVELELNQLEGVNYIAAENEEQGRLKVERHQWDMYLDVSGHRYWINDESANGKVLERLLKASGSDERWQQQKVSSAELRYIDWVIPGVLGMNMMFSALYGVGYVIVRYRKNGVLKRLSATPLRTVEFLISQLISRLWIILATGTAVYICLNLLFSFRMHGSYALLLLVYAMGVFSLISLGLIISARLATEEVADGILNLISWPMMFLSGIWFSLDGAHPAMKVLSQAFPLTHVTSAARSVMLDGAGFMEIVPQLLTLAGMSAVFLMVGVWLFRWES